MQSPGISFFCCILEVYLMHINLETLIFLGKIVRALSWPQHVRSYGYFCQYFEPVKSVTRFIFLVSTVKLPGQSLKKSATARSSKNHGSPAGKNHKHIKPCCKSKKRIRSTSGKLLCDQKPAKRYKLEAKKQRMDKVCEHNNKPISRFKLIKRCELAKKPQKTLKHERRPLKNLKPLKTPLKTHKFKHGAYRTRRIANKPPPPRIKIQSQKTFRRSNMSAKMDVDDPQDCSSSENSSLNLSEPVPVPRKPSTKRPLGFKALLFRLFGLNPKRRPKPQPFQF